MDGGRDGRVDDTPAPVAVLALVLLGLEMGLR